MKKAYKLTIIAVITLLMTSASYAQEWTKEQQEVWKVVQNTWDNWKTKNVDGISATLHNKYQGWSAEAPLPMGKQELVQWFTGMKDMMKMNYYFISPARITVTANAAVVDYYYEFSGEYTMNGKTFPEESKGKSVEFYVKEEGKWLLLGDFMNKDGDDDEEDD